MKRLSAAGSATLLLLLCACAPSFGQEHDLRLTAGVAGERYCKVNESVDALQLTLELKYTNTGGGKLILYKGNRLFYQTFISSGGADAAASRNELRTTHSRYFDEQPEKIVSPAPGSAFAVLSPGASYVTRQVVSVPVARDGNGKYNVSVGAGEHTLSVASSTWYESKKTAEDLRQRWRSRGFLWTDPLISNSITFAVDKNRAPSACQ